jgi:tRNA 2-thiouridine synthesizing protein D
MNAGEDFVITLGYNKASASRVTLAFTAGVAAIERDLQPTIILLLEGVHAAQEGYIDDIDIGEPFLCVKDLLEVYFAQGGRMMACGACWKLQQIPDQELMAGIKLVKAGDVVELLANAKGSLQLN